MHAHTMPAVFFGHGSPMNAIEHNDYTRQWAAIGAEMGRPRAVLAVSAHWHTRGLGATAMLAPPTIHDFGNFPAELHAIEYPAPGDPALAASLRGLLSPADVVLDQSWGLDHGTWSVLRHVFPAADVPVVQLSIDATRSPAALFDLAKRLAPLRDDGVFIMGSGNVVHNLDRFDRAGNARPAPWALAYEARVREAVAAGDTTALIAYDSLTPDAALAAPDIEHYLPLLYVMAVRRAHETPAFPTSGIVGGAISMLSVRFG